jgi:Protein of unknown function (DUF2970)
VRSFFSAVRAVLSAFIGIRRHGAAQQDQAIRPVHLLLAALICVALLVGALVVVVRSVV